ncbi:MAG: N-6 DNA methylase [Anaerolineae bacterium]|nr:N-6 DNA methylase [Anaerolineae bacterium]
MTDVRQDALREFEHRRGPYEAPRLGNEAELRHAFAAVLERAGIRLYLERDRHDARLNHIILEFKAPGAFQGRVTSHPFREAFEQLGRYIVEQSIRDGWERAAYVGVACDGFHLAYVFYEAHDLVRHTALVPLNAATFDILLRYLRDDVRRAFTVENVLNDFGPGSPVARDLIAALWNLLEQDLAAGAERPKTGMLFAEWKSLFAQVADLSHAQQGRLEGFNSNVGLPHDADPSRLLFVLHTYNAILLKLLAAELVTTFRLLPDVGSGFAAHAAALPTDELRTLLAKEVERSQLFRRVNLHNLIEGTYFTWYLTGGEPVLESMRELLKTLALYRFSDHSAERTRDLLKRLYERLVPELLRKNLGEFYTPDWLAEFTLDQAGYRGADVLRLRLLDPCCGSGTFLVLALRRFLDAGRQAMVPPDELLARACDAVVGFDLNPLAVIAARVNYLLAVTDLLSSQSDIEIPVYLADAVYAPAVRPLELWDSECNYFASVAVGRFERVVGNPPWVRWSRLPESYRQRAKPTCDWYGIFSKTPFFGGNELDISGIITFTSADKWLADGGRLTFVITRSHFRAPSSQGVRRFRLPDGTPLQVEVVHDLVAVNPFPRLANKPAVLVLNKGRETTYPVPYVVWGRKAGASISEDADWSDIQEAVDFQRLDAMPLAPDGGRWSVLGASDATLLELLSGGSRHLRGRKGVTTDLNGVYFIEILGPAPGGRLRFRNTPESGRKQVAGYVGDIESDLVYPLIKGAANIRAFRASIDTRCILIPNRTIHNIPPVERFARDYQYALRYLQLFEPLLVERSTYRTRMKNTGAPFYAVYNVGPYTFQPYKVVWAEQSSTLEAAVVSTAQVPHLGERLVVPDHKVFFAAFDDETEAHFVCALLNSEPVRTFVDSFTVKLQVGTLFDVLRLPPFDAHDPLHLRLATLSRQAHTGADLRAEVNTCAEEALWR